MALLDSDRATPALRLLSCLVTLSWEIRGTIEAISIAYTGCNKNVPVRVC